MHASITSRSNTCCRLPVEDVRHVHVVIPNLDQEINDSSNAGTPASDRYETSQHAPAVVSPLD